MISMAVTPELAQDRQSLDRRVEGARRREGADVQFVDDQILGPRHGPGVDGASESFRVQDRGRLVDAVGLPQRGRVLLFGPLSSR